jgi:hypothetical protein
VAPVTSTGRVYHAVFSRRLSQGDALMLASRRSTSFARTCSVILLRCPLRHRPRGEQRGSIGGIVERMGVSQPFPRPLGGAVSRR